MGASTLRSVFILILTLWLTSGSAMAQGYEPPKPPKVPDNLNYSEQPVKIPNPRGTSQIVLPPLEGEAVARIPGTRSPSWFHVRRENDGSITNYFIWIFPTKDPPWGRCDVNGKPL